MSETPGPGHCRYGAYRTKIDLYERGKIRVQVISPCQNAGMTPIAFRSKAMKRLYDDRFHHTNVALETVRTTLAKRP